MPNSKKGFAIPTIVAIVAVLAIGGGGFVYKNRVEAPKIKPIDRSFNISVPVNIPTAPNIPNVNVKYDVPIVVPPAIPSSPSPEPVACTMDAMMCPDGYYVGRSGPNCEFVCPNKINSSQIETIIVASSINGNFVGDDILVLTDDKGIKWTIKYNSATYYEENVFAKPSIWVSDFSNWLVSRKKILSSNYDGPGIPGAVKIIGLVDVNGILNASKIIQHVQ